MKQTESMRLQSEYRKKNNINKMHKETRHKKNEVKNLNGKSKIDAVVHHLNFFLNEEKTTTNHMLHGIMRVSTEKLFSWFKIVFFFVC